MPDCSLLITFVNGSSTRLHYSHREEAEESAQNVSLTGGRVKRLAVTQHGAPDDVLWSADWSDTQRLLWKTRFGKRRL